MREERIVRRVKQLSALALMLIVIYPLLNMLMQIERKDIGIVLTNGELYKALLNSLKVTIIASFISLSLAYILAYAISQTNIWFKKWFAIIFTLPMLLPSVSHGLGIINALGQNGLLTRWLNINMDVYGFNGIVIGSVIYTLPVAFLLLLDGMKYIDKSKYEIVSVLGIPKYRQAFVVVWPYMKKPILMSFFAIGIMIFTDYGIPIAVGGRYTTLAMYLYTEVIGLLNFSKGAIIGVILLIPSIINFLLDVGIKDVSSTCYARNIQAVRSHKIRDYLLMGICSCVSASIILFFVAFGVMGLVTKYPYDLTFSIEHIVNVLNKGGLKQIGNSIWISINVAIFGTIVAYMIAYITTRLKQDILTKIMHFAVISSIAIPGIVLGLGYMLSFKGTFIYKTTFILVLINIVHFITSPYLMARNAMQKLNSSYEEIGEALSISRLRLIKDVFIPNTRETILEMITYFFINSMTTISAVTFVYGIKNMPASIMVQRFVSSLMIEEAAIVSLMILGVNLIFKLVICTIKKRHQ